jgi:hypothetical protein
MRNVSVIDTIPALHRMISNTILISPRTNNKKLLFPVIMKYRQRCKCRHTRQSCSRLLSLRFLKFVSRLSLRNFKREEKAHATPVAFNAQASQNLSLNAKHSPTLPWLRAASADLTFCMIGNNPISGFRLLLKDKSRICSHLVVTGSS